MSDVSRSDFDEIAQDFLRIRDVLSKNKEITLVARFDDIFRRYLLVSVVSRLEQKRKCVAKKAFHFLSRESRSQASDRNISFNSRFIARFFNNLGSRLIGSNSPFFSFLGEKINSMDVGLLAIISLFDDRNDLIHNDFAFKSTDVSATDVIQIFEQAVDFLDRMTSYCEEYKQPFLL